MQHLSPWLLLVLSAVPGRTVLISFSPYMDTPSGQMLSSLHWLRFLVKLQLLGIILLGLKRPVVLGAMAYGLVECDKWKSYKYWVWGVQNNSAIE